MTPRRFKQRGAGELIRFGVGRTALGSVLVATTRRGVCAIELGRDPSELSARVRQRFANATFERDDRAVSSALFAVRRFLERPAQGLELALDLSGTIFQERVWAALQRIPPGETRSYADLARELGKPSAARAVAGACARNPIALAIPCHRAVGADGKLRGYRWGLARKRRLLAREASDPRSRSRNKG
jgi:AraC family transcriptional regulator of adaptative response/methylated-DNA-[protein]-cysteine methyltransferase